jgi:CubicO group peptidase (beta-lactamase class C family)
MIFRTLLFTLAVATAAGSAAADPGLSPDAQARIDRGAAEVLASTGVPSASIAVVKDGKLVYAKAYGLAELDPARPATPDMRYGIGSISKEFTAAAILILAQQGKLSLDDKVGRFVPGLTDGDRITLRQILSHTAGYRDYWPQDYVFEDMRHPATPDQILARWAKTPLDFPPGTDWQYSNTGYVLAGLIVEKVSGEPLTRFLAENVFKPLHMDRVEDDDIGPLPPTDARPYTRYALGPARPAPKEAAGWLFAAGELAMTPADLAKWDISEIDHNLLSAKSYTDQTTSIVLASGRDSHYALGLRVGTANGRRLLEHGGEVSGFLSENRIWPDQKAAVVVLTNADYGDATDALADRIERELFPTDDRTARQTLVARAVFDELRQGRLDRSRLSPNGAGYFTETAVRDFHDTLAPLGEPTGFRQLHASLRGGMTSEVYEAVYPTRKLRIILRALPDGKIEQFMVSPVAE